MKLKLILMALMACCCLVVNAQNEPNSLLFEMRDGSSVAFLYEEQPVLMFNDNDIIVKTNLHEMSYPLDSVRRYVFTYTENGLINSPVIDSVRLSGENLFISDVKPGSLVTLVTIDGKLLVSDTVDAYGKCTLSLTSFPSGVYLLNYSDVSVKIVKP